MAAISVALLAWMPGSAQAGKVQAVAGATGIVNIPVGSNPSALGVDATTDTIYVANFSSDSVSVIDGAKAAVTTTVTVGTDPAAVVVDESTDKVYVANDGDGTVSVIDGATNKVTDTIGISNVSGGPIPGTDALAIDSASDLIYVAWHNGIAVIDGSDDDVSYPSSIFAEGTGIDDSMAFDGKNHDLYLVNFTNDQAVQVIDTSNDQTTSPIDVGERPVAVAVNSSASTLYAINCKQGFFNGIWVINASDDATDAEIQDGCPDAVATDQADNTAYVIDADTGDLSVISPTFKIAVPAIGVGEEPSAVAVDPDTGVVYVTDRTISGNLTALALAAPVITSKASVNFQVGLHGSFQVRATGVPQPVLAESGRLPRGVKLTASGSLSGTAAPGTGGAYKISISATNGIGQAATQAFTLDVRQRAAITSHNRVKITAGHKADFVITTSGFPAPKLTEKGKLPKGLTFHARAGGTATLTGTPAKSAAGHSFVITISAANGVGAAATQKLTIQVQKK